ncbi:MAG: DUF3977 family protein [Candidatus Pacearchaeota archaeon]
MKKEKVYAEIGIGNDSFKSTEIEIGKKEYRINKFVKPKQINGYYIRIWIFKKGVIISTNEGIKFFNKDKNKFKLLFGISGVKLK